MTRYADGTEARLGDIVRGKPHNTPHEVIGPIVSLTPGQDMTPTPDQGMCEVAFVKFIMPEMVYSGDYTIVRDRYDRLTFMQAVTDYGETRAFTKIA